MATHADWLSLVELSGLVVSEPVIEERFPGGPASIPRGLHTWFRSRAAAYEVAKEADDDAGVRKWIDFLLGPVLDLDGDQWLKAHDVPDTCRTWLDQYQQELRADRALVRDDKPLMLVQVIPSKQGLDRQDRQPGKWKASPATKLERLLRDTGCELGLVTNGAVFRLLFAPAGMNAGSITWTSAGMIQEKATLDAFATLLGHDTVLAEGDVMSLLDICKLSRDRQGDVADQLGVQVRDGVERLLWAWDRADRKVDGALLADMTEDDIYEMGLVVMMRLVFLLYAEERSLLPHGEVLYDQGYGLTYLWHRLSEQKREREPSLDQTHDAWDRFLATGRLIHGGCRHPDLSLRAYGGNLFDPKRYPVLEDERCRVTNHTMHDVLYKLLFARQRRGGEPQRVGYWALDVEQIGYVYEGLLDHRCALAGDVPDVKMKWAGEAAIPVTDLEAMERDELVAWAVKESKWSEERVVEALDEPSERDLQALTEFPREADQRVRPFAGLIQCREIVPPGWRYLTTGVSRRASGAHYTPQALTERVVRVTLEPQVFRCEEGKPGKYIEPREVKTPRELLDLKVCDMAMGSGAFLVQAIRYLGDRLVEAWDREVAGAVDGAVLTMPFGEVVDDPEGQPVLRPEDREEMTLWARRYVAERCIYGVDVNPLAVEMAKLSLWLTTLAKDRPFTFLDHALKFGDSLVGVDAEQLRSWSLDRKGSSLPLLEDVTAVAVDRALELRRKLADVAVVEAEDIDRKTTLLTEAEQAMDFVRFTGDLLLAPSFATVKAKKQAALRDELQVAFHGAIVDEDWEALAARGREMLGAQRTFHWVFEFPEVFLDGDSGGFDAVVGNPPFMGGKKLTGHFGKTFREHLVGVLGSGTRGVADLVAYFYLRAQALLGGSGTFGLIATNTIAQGDTREVGLDQVVKRGGLFFNALKSMAWPGVANLEVSLVHAVQGTWHGSTVLDEVPVPTISPLLDTGEGVVRPKRLVNSGLNYQGANILGIGFTMAPEEAQEWIEKNPQNAEVLQPYINGKDLNTHPEQQSSRWVINFKDWSLAKAEQWPDMIEIVREKVKPERDKKKRKQYREIWWRFAEKQAALYRAIEPLDRVLVRPEVSRTWAFSFVPNGWVYSHMLIVFPTNRACDFLFLQSVVHQVWSEQFASSMRTDLRYTPSDCVDTFPFPTADPTAPNPEIDAVGEEYHEHRAAIMRDRWLGLTKTYNLFHEPECTDDDIQHLRALHVEMDRAVRDAYGWSDLDLEHGWIKTVTPRERKNRKTGQVDSIEKVDWRYTISEQARQQVLRRLLDLNHQRYLGEVAAGLHDKKKGTRKRRKDSVKERSVKENAHATLDLFRRREP